jgi:hypothetical protein
MLKPYPSGFLGSNTVAQTNQDNMVDVRAAVNQMFNRADTSKVSKHTSNIEINSIWSEVLSSNLDYNTFEFKQRVLKAALNAFGTDTLAQWISAQYSNPEFTHTHHKFIDETIEFVSSNKRREYTFSNWTMLLTCEAVEHDTPKYTEIQQKYLLSQNPKKLGLINTSKTIEEFILDWVRQPKGIDDLTSSLFVLFGIR